MGQIHRWLKLIQHMGFNLIFKIISKAQKCPLISLIQFKILQTTELYFVHIVRTLSKAGLGIHNNWTQKLCTLYNVLYIYIFCIKYICAIDNAFELPDLTLCYAEDKTRTLNDFEVCMASEGESAPFFLRNHKYTLYTYIVRIYSKSLFKKLSIFTLIVYM